MQPLKPGDVAPPLGARNILAFIFSIVALRFLLKLMGFGEKLTLTYFIPAGELDVFWVALSVPMSVYFISGAAIVPTLLPMFLRRKNAGDSAGAWGQVHTWLLVGFFLLVAFCALALSFSDQIAAVLAPGFEEARHEHCARLLRLMIPASIAAGLLPVLFAVLDAHRKFTIAPVADIFSKGTLIAAVVLWATSTGVNSAAWGALAGYAASLIVCETFLWKHWDIPGSGPDIKDPDFRLVAFLMLAPAAGNAASRIGNFVENGICSSLDPGSITYLALAQKLINMPLLIIPIAAGTVLFTVFVELKQRNDEESLAAMLGTAVRAMLFLFLPLTVLTLLLSGPVVSIVYQRGAFDASSVPPVANLFRLLAPLLCLLSIEVIIMRYFFSRAELWTPALIGIACVALRLILLFVLVERLGLAALGVAIVSSRFAKISWLLLLIVRRGNVRLDQLGVGDVGKLLLATAGGMAAGYAALRLIEPGLGGGLASQLLLIGAVSTVALGVYVLIAYISGNTECRYATADFARRFARQA